ncbi:MAG: YlxR family protein [Caldilineaceae bacterium]
MNKQKGVKPKYVPKRTCIACRKIEGKRALIRIVRTDSGVEVDPSGKKAGRGAYLCANQQCWEAALRGNRLDQALRTKISAENRQSLLAYAANLPEAEAVESENV